MLSRLLASALALVLLAGVMIAHDNASAVAPQTDAANAAVDYIESLQNADGGFPAGGTDSSPSASIDAAFALRSAGVDAAIVSQHGGATLRDYLLSQTPPAGDPGALAKFSYALTLLGLGGGTLVPEMRQYVTHDGYGDDVFDEAFYVFALVAADESLPVSAAFLRSIQLPDGGWEFAATFGSDSNTTAMALQALIAAGGGAGEAAVRSAVDYLATTQNDDGGFGFTATDDSDPDSTALAIQALVAAGESIDSGRWVRGGHAPMDGLLSFRNSATGAFQYGGMDSPFATYQSVPALMLAPFPSLETSVTAAPTPQSPGVVTVTPTATQSSVVLPSAGGRGDAADSSWWAIAAAGAMGVAGAGALAAGRRRR